MKKQTPLNGTNIKPRETIKADIHESYQKPYKNASMSIKKPFIRYDDGARIRISLSIKTAKYEYNSTINPLLAAPNVCQILAKLLSQILNKGKFESPEEKLLEVYSRMKPKHS